MSSISQTLLPGVPLVESMLFSLSVDDMDLTNQERDIAVQLNERGYAVFDFPDDDFDARAERIKADLAPQFDLADWQVNSWARHIGMRAANAWLDNDDIKAIACNVQVISLLSKLYGRKAFPFQTLNFPVGTQQHVHTDTVHFSSIPERFMCGVWVALEDVGPDQGPLTYYPGSHKWPIVSNEMIGKYVGSERFQDVQGPYEPVWRELARATGIKPDVFCAKKGQAVIWAANLLHGGSKQNDPTLTRWSQVTHYYFENCTYYKPAYTDALRANMDVLDVPDIRTDTPVTNTYLGHATDDLIERPVVHTAAPAGMMGDAKPILPKDFEAGLYYRLNPDVKRAGADAAQHYLLHGFREGRRYK